jgi:outer membrane protein assembly factor BamD (BamD/ComL family)
VTPEDAEFLRLFQTCELPFNQWTHRSHVKIAYLYLSQHDFPQALAALGPAIQRYNAANKVPESETRGYNQTTTQALLHIIAAVMRAYAKTHPAQSADEFCDKHPELMSQYVLRFFYSPQRRMHPLAKTTFIEPDLAPLPKILDQNATNG